MRSRQGKMEKSFLSFTEAYPDWNPGDHGNEVLGQLEGFAIKHGNVVMSKSLHFGGGGTLPPRSMSPTTVTPPEASINITIVTSCEIAQYFENRDNHLREEKRGKSLVGIDGTPLLF